MMAPKTADVNILHSYHGLHADHWEANVKNRPTVCFCTNIYIFPQCNGLGQECIFQFLGIFVAATLILF